MPETIIPKDKTDWLRHRLEDVTSTEVSSLFDISPYMTRFELWWRKKSKTIVELEPNQRMLWGTRLESAIAYGVAEDNGWKVAPMKQYMRLPQWRLGSSFDFSIEPDGLLEIKNVDSLAYKDGWLINGDSVEAPPFIELQIQNELLVSERKYVILAALIGGNRVVLIKREADPQIHEAIKSRVAAFWQSIDANQEPVPDFKADADFICKLAGYAEPGKVMNAGDTLAAQVKLYKEWGEKATAAQEEKDAIKAQLLTLIGDAERVIGNGYTISASMKAPTLVEAYTRKGYRDFRVYLKKESK
jgi:predicted phage-related endonuclease